MLFSTPVTWDVRKVHKPKKNPALNKLFSFGCLAPGKYKIGLQLDAYYEYRV